MTHEGPHAFERFLESAARRLGGSDLHPIELLQRVRSAAEASARAGNVANDIVITLHQDDYHLFSAEADRIVAEIHGALDSLEATHGWSRIGERTVRFRSSAAVPRGASRVEARFVDTAHRRGTAVAGATRRLSRHRDLDIVLGDGSRVPLTHTPFSIGRGPGNDLVVLSLAVSRHHAEIQSTPAGFVLVDNGSRNGIVCDGERRESVPLVPGRQVTLGDIELRVEPREPLP